MKACYKKCKQAGIGLLELMLAMAIIAILIVMSIAYFSSSKNSELVSAGVEQMQDIFGVLSGLPNPDAGDITKTVALSGSIPKEYLGSSNGSTIGTPWGGSSQYTISFTAGTAGSDGTAGTIPIATITGKNLPNYACASLATKLPGSSSDTTAPTSVSTTDSAIAKERDNVIFSGCGTDGKTLTIVYDMSTRQGVTPHTISS